LSGKTQKGNTVSHVSTRVLTFKGEGTTGAFEMTPRSCSDSHINAMPLSAQTQRGRRFLPKTGAGNLKRGKKYGIVKTKNGKKALPVLLLH